MTISRNQMFPTAVATAVSALLLTQRAQAQTFSTFDISGVFEGDPFDVGDGPRPPPPDGTTIALPVPTSKGDLVRLCGCTNETEPKVDDIRSISDTWASSGTRVSSHGFSNLLWAWGKISIGVLLVLRCDFFDVPLHVCFNNKCQLRACDRRRRRLV